MRQIKVTAARVLDARPEDVYASIADYEHGHPNIVPKESFYDLQVEEGGYGAGTIMRFKLKTLDAEFTFHQQVSEPEPGRVLVEQRDAPPERPPLEAQFDWFVRRVRLTRDARFLVVAAWTNPAPPDQRPPPSVTVEELVRRTPEVVREVPPPPRP